MPTPDPNRAANGTPTGDTGDTGAAAPACAWLSVGDAAALLGVSARAVQKRAERGTLPARRVAHGRAFRWEIDGRELDANASAKGSQDVRKMGAKRSQDGRDGAASERESVRKTGANRSQDGREPARELSGEREAELKSEISFLRGIVESDRRDMAELRAALREALKLAPKQLNAAPLDANNHSTGDAPERARAASGAVVSNGAHPSPDQRTGAALTYGDIADALERDLAARGS